MTKRKNTQSSTQASEPETTSNGNIKKMAPKSAPAQSSGGGFGFQLFIFFIASSSVALNVGIIYGVVPIKGMAY